MKKNKPKPTKFYRAYVKQCRVVEEVGYLLPDGRFHRLIRTSGQSLYLSTDFVKKKLRRTKKAAENDLIRSIDKRILQFKKYIYRYEQLILNWEEKKRAILEDDPK